MKRKFTTLFFGLTFILSSFAQTNAIDSTKAMFDNLPGFLYPSELLHNRSPLFSRSFINDSSMVWNFDSSYTASPYLFPGQIPASVVRKNQFSMLYNDMYHSSTNPQIIADGAIFRMQDSIARANVEVPIAAMHLNFQRMYHNAVANGLLWFDTATQKYEVLPDTLWIDQANGIYQYYPNPDSLAVLAFADHELFVGALTNAVIHKSGSQFTITFNLESSLFVSNQTIQPTLIEMDFDNGQGFQPIQMDVPKAITYNASSGWDSNERHLRLRLRYGAKVVETKMPLIIVPNTVVADTSFNVSSLVDVCNMGPNGFLPGDAKVSIRYGNPTKKLRKPIIITEGFESETQDYGIISFEGLTSGFIYDNNGERQFEQAELLKNTFDSLSFLGYDLVYIDHKNPRDYIQANSYNLIKLIQWTNATLISNNSYEKLVVVGASMGGLLARHALSRMEAEGCCHNTRVYITFDTPHNGANIPVGLQAMVKHLYEDLGWIDNVLDVDLVKPHWEHVLNSPGARQMLAVHIGTGAKAEREAFMRELDSLGHPKDCRKIAISNGSEQGLQNAILDAQKRLIGMEKYIYLPKFHHSGSSYWQPPANIIGKPYSFFNFFMQAYGESRSDSTIFEANDFTIASQLLPIILATHGVSAAIQNAALILKSIFPIWTPTANAFIILTQNITNIALPALHIANSVSGLLGNSTVVPIHAIQANYTESPGSTAQTAYDVAKGLFGLATVYTSAHSFIPSVSALDIDTSDVFLDIEANRKDLNENYIPFDSYWAPARADGQQDRNMKHIEVTTSLHYWLIDHIDHNDELRDPQTGAYEKTLTTYYNFGYPGGLDWDKPFLRFLYSVDVVNGGNLNINKLGKIGFNTGQYSTASGSEFVAKTGSSCDEPLVRIKNGGTFVIGDSNNKASMHFREMSTLEIFPGGTLQINENSTLFIEEGAELIVHPGATIELNGTNAVLDLRGKVTLMPNAVLSASGSGFIRFAQPMISPADVPTYWSVDSTAAIQLSSTNGNKRAEILTDFFAPSDLSMFEVSDAGVAIAPEKALHVYNSPVNFQGAQFYSTNPAAGLHAGVHLNGQSATIDNSSFKNGVVGLNNNLSQNTKFVAISNSSFTNNEVGLRLSNGTFELQQCVLRYNDNGLEGLALSSTSTISQSTFAHNTDYGISVKTANNGALEIIESAINDNEQGIAIENGRLRSTCSNISSNTVGVRIKSSFLNIADSAFNQLTNNIFGIQAIEAFGIFLEGGFNDFSGSGTYITGTLATLNANANLDLLDNRMPGTSNALPIFLNYITTSNSLAPVPIVNWNGNVNLMVTCTPPPGKTGNEVAAGVFDRLYSFKVINTTNFSNIFFNDALKEAARMVSTTDEIFDDLQAINRFNEILGSVSAPFTDIEQIAIEKAVEMMVTALNNIYEQGLIPRNGAALNEDEHPYLELVTNQIASRLGGTNISAEQLFNYNLLLAQTYRMAEHYDYALNVLGNLQTASGVNLTETEYWQCVCDAENNLLLGQIEPDQFSYQLEACRTMLYTMQKRQPVPMHGTSEVQSAIEQEGIAKAIFPNPTSSVLVVDLGEMNSSVSVEIIATSGVVVQRNSFDTVNRCSIDVSSLPSGTYLLKLITSQQSETLRFVKL